MKHSKKSLLSIAFMLLLSMILAACSGGEKSSDDKKDGNNEAKSGGDLTIAWPSDAVSLDPHGSNDVPSSNVQYNIYETLVYQDENIEIQPGLAESWEQVDDLTWEFKLREGVKFHDGSELNADVVVANFDRLKDPKVASPRAHLYEMVTEVKAVDTYKVQIKTEYPFAPLLAHLAHTGGSIISKEAIDKDYEAMENGEKAGSYISKNPSGTGPFKLEDWVAGQHIKLVKNENYWGEPAKLNSVTFKVVPEALTRVAELETGTVHISDNISPSDMSRIDNLDNADIKRQTSLSLAYLGFNIDKEPFNNVKVRQAISMAIDKQQILEGIYEGTGVPAVGPLAPDVYGFDDSVKPLEYNLEEAKKLLKEAGYEKGFKTTIWTNEGNAERLKIAEYVQSALRELNIEVEIQSIEWGTYLADTAAGKHNMFILGWSTATADADYAMYPLFHSSMVGEPGNRTFLKDSELDKILEEARKETDDTKRKALYKQAQEKLVELAPMVYLLHTEYITGVSTNVKGFSTHPSGMYLLRNVTIEE